MMAEVGSSTSGPQTISAVDEEAIHLEFEWKKSCFKGKYPSWRLVHVTNLLNDRGLTNEKLEHEMSIFYAQIDEIYGICMKCFVMTYILILLVGLAAIGGIYTIFI